MVCYPSCCYPFTIVTAERDLWRYGLLPLLPPLHSSLPSDISGDGLLPFLLLPLHSTLWRAGSLTAVCYPSLINEIKTQPENYIKH